MTLPKGRQRARSAEEKAGRAEALVAAARRALERDIYDAVTMTDVAAEIGLSKASAYLYFPTKESLFLRVIEDELGAWFARVERGLKSTTAAGVPKLIARSLAEEPVLLQLLTLLHGRIETNLTLNEIAGFKAFLGTSLTRVGAALEQKLALAKGRGAQLLLRLHALTIGLKQMADPPDLVRAAIRANPPLAAMVPDFEAELAAALADWIKAWR
jgi:AcrR family transcriptional regulator